MSAMPVLILILCLMAIAYRYYSAFLAAKVAALDDSRTTPATLLNDGQNFHPTNKWVLFGHHFAAISGAGPLIGPVLAAQFGYMPGLLWIVIGVCLGGAVQDFLVLVASTRRNGKSLAQMAYSEIGKTAGTAGTAAILFIIIIALAGLGKVVVKALGGEEVQYGGTKLVLPANATMAPTVAGGNLYDVPAGSFYDWGTGRMEVTKSFTLRAPSALSVEPDGTTVKLPKGTVRLVPGSKWGTFTIAATIPIALLVGLYMYKIRPGRVTEASIIGAILTLAATVAGGWVADHHIGEWFNLTGAQVTWAMAIYGFVAAVLPVWVLLAPRDYLSSFLKIGTIALLVVGVVVANPTLQTPAINTTFLGGGPIVPGTIFPFLFITVMCGAISGFHALVSSGTTPKMVANEKHTRVIGYGAMMIEGLVAVVAMIAAASLAPVDYYAMNTELSKVPEFHERILAVGGAHGVQDVNVGQIDRYEHLTEEALRGRTGGAVTLAVGMAKIFEDVAIKLGADAQHALDAMWKYWFHFAIMFEALFILTTIDAGTRIGRFLVQEVGGKLHPSLGKSNSIVGGYLATAIVVVGWALFMSSDNFSVIWQMFGIANQTLAIIALSVLTAWLANEGRVKYIWVTLAPMGVIIITTGSSATLLLTKWINGIVTASNSGKLFAKEGLTAMLMAFLILAMVLCATTVIVSSLRRVMRIRREGPPASLSAA